MFVKILDKVTKQKLLFKITKNTFNRWSKNDKMVIKKFAVLDQ